MTEHYCIDKEHYNKDACAVIIYCYYFASPILPSSGRLSNCQAHRHADAPFQPKVGNNWKTPSITINRLPHLQLSHPSVHASSSTANQSILSAPLAPSHQPIISPEDKVGSPIRTILFQFFVQNSGGYNLPSSFFLDSSQSLAPPAATRPSESSKPQTSYSHWITAIIQK